MKPINYNSIAHAYARNRPAKSFVIDELLRGCSLNSDSKVLEVGCGTGSHILMVSKATNCQGWGVEPSEEMISYRGKSEKTQFLVGTAEELPFKDKYFDFLFSVDVIHHLNSAISYFREAFRVLKAGGVLCTVTDSERNIKNEEPLSKYWPSRIDVDLKRYPAISILKQQMSDIGFIDIDERHIQSTYEIHDISPYREKAFSCLHLITEDEYIKGLQNLEKDLKAGPVLRRSMYTCIWGRSSIS